MIAFVTIRNFKALRNAKIALMPFNLIIGPNGSGKTSLIQALQRLRTLAKLPLASPSNEHVPEQGVSGGPEIIYQFMPPHDGLEVVMRCISDTQCDFLDVVELPRGEGKNDWAGLRKEIMRIRAYVLDHRALAVRSLSRDSVELKSDGANLAAVIAAMKIHHPEAFESMRAELCRILTEYDDIQWRVAEDSSIELQLRLADTGELIPAEEISQGTLYLLGILALAFDPDPPSIVCIEELDRGFHPRLLREVRDVLYRLSYPEAYGLKRPAVQVITTTHSPYMLDLFSEHPEEVVVAEKQGSEARFWRLSDRKDLADLLSDGGLGDMWYSGILGGVPQESTPPFEIEGATDNQDDADENR